MSKKVSILIAEDEKPLSKALALKLSGSGFLTTVAHDGEEAINLIKSNTFDLLLLDLIMPKLDGFAVLEKLRAEGNNVPVMVLSNLGQEEDVSRVKSLGVVNYFIKSDVPIANIVEQVQKYFNYGK